MTTLNEEQIYRTMQRVDDFIPVMQKHIEASDKQHEDSGARISSLEEDRRFFKRLLVIGAIVWPMLYNVVKEIIVNVLSRGGDGLEAMLTFQYLIKIL